MFVCRTTTTHQVQRRVQLDRLTEHCHTNVYGAVGAKRCPRMNGLIAVVVERPHLKRLVQPADSICHGADVSKTIIRVG